MWQCPLTVVKQFKRHVSAASSAPSASENMLALSALVMIQFTLKFTSSPGREFRSLPLVNRDPGAAPHHSSRLSPHLSAFCYDCLCWCKQTPGGRDNKTLRPRFVCVVSKQIFITDFLRKTKPRAWLLIHFKLSFLSHNFTQSKAAGFYLSLGNWFFVKSFHYQ